MKKQKIYISGAITGIDNYEELFSNAEKELIEQGFEVVNPVTIEQNHDNTWNSFMRVDLKAMLDCDAIYMLSNYKKSRGANIELNLAKELGFEVYYEEHKTKVDIFVFILAMIILVSFFNIWMSIFYIDIFGIKKASYSALFSILSMVISYVSYERLIRKNR